MRKLAYKTTIDAIEPMDADTLEVARIKGWRAVVRKGEFKAGDVVLYIEADAAISAHDDRFEFLRERCYKKFMAYGKLFDECLRIRTIKLRGVISQGVVMDPALFCEIRNKPLEEDCCDVLYIRHYDEVAERAVRETAPFRPKDQKGVFPECIRRTDEQRIQNLDDETLETQKNTLLYKTEKYDGTSMTVAAMPFTRPDDPIAVCSRNFELKDVEGCAYWEMAHKLNELPQRLLDYCETHWCELALQGEMVGPGIACNPDKFEERDYYVFRVWDIGAQGFLDDDKRHELCKELGLRHVADLGTCTLADYKKPEDDWVVARDALLKEADGVTVRGNPREGIVYKSKDGSFSFKAVSNQYLLRKGKE